MGNNSEWWDPSSQELKELLKRHEHWVKSEYQKGQRADLSGANLQDVDLPKVELAGAILKGAHLGGANLSNAHLRGAYLQAALLMEADLSGAVLQGARLQRATLTGADLRGANLTNADLAETIGLQVPDIARTNTSNAKLPEDVSRFEGLNVLEEATKNARKLFISMGLVCLYAVLAISTESATERFLELPIIGIEMEVWKFFYVVPILLALEFGYFHLQLQRVWEEMANLPAIFPDGKGIDQKHPWLVTGIARAYIPYIRDEQPQYFRLQWLAVFGLAWFSVPATQAYFVVQFIRCYQEEVLQSGLGTALVALTLGGAIHAYWSAASTLRGESHFLWPFSEGDKNGQEGAPSHWTGTGVAMWIIISFLLCLAAWFGALIWFDAL